MKSLLFLSVTLLSACTSRLLVPLTYNSQTDKSTSMISELDSVSVITENIEVNGGYLVFDMEVDNHSDKPIEIRPDYIWYYASPAQFKPLDDPSEDAHSVSMFYNNGFNYKERAMRPSEVGAFFSERLRVKQGVSIFLLLAGAGLIINDAVQDTKDVNKTEWTPSDAKKADARAALTTAGLLAIDVANESLAASAYQDHTEIQYLPDELFPQKIITPGDTFRGKVFFRKQELYKYYRMIVPIGDTDFVFDFKKATPK